MTPHPPSHRVFLAKYELSSSMKAEAGRILSLWLDDLLQMAVFQGAVGSGYWHFRVTEVFFQIQSCLHSSSDQCVCESRVAHHFVPAHVTVQKEYYEGQTFSTV